MRPVSHLRVVPKNKSIDDMNYEELCDFQQSVARLYNFTPEDFKEMEQEKNQIEPVRSVELGPWTKITVAICNFAILVSSITLCFVVAFFVWVIFVAFMR